MNYSCFTVSLRLKSYIKAVLLVLCLGASLAPTAKAESRLIQREVSFEHNSNTLNGVLTLPTLGHRFNGCVIFVHGSGDMPRDAHGYYEPLWRLFANKGWCSLSWDKPGTVDSEGDWRTQSMDDRAAEVITAIEYLRTQDGLGDGQMGLIGFSQAGWVLPKVANAYENIAFLVSVSGAVNWMDQSYYSGRQRMLAEGLTEEEIRAEERVDDRINALIRNHAPYHLYLEQAADEGITDPMSEAFWGFAKRNWDADVRDDLLVIDTPMLALFGTHDAYVDPLSSAHTYRRILERSAAPFFEVRLFEQADHGLMKTKKIEPSHSGLDAWFMLLKIWFLGDDIFAEGVLEELDEWLDRFPYPDMLILHEAEQ